MSYRRALRPMSDKLYAQRREAGLLVPGSTFAAKPRKRTSVPRSTGPSVETVELLIVRCTRGGVPCCEGCGEPLYGSRSWDWSVQHRRPRGMGGSSAAHINCPCALLVLCGHATTPDSCHLRAESRRGEAVDMGWLVAMGTDPATKPVLIDRGSRWVLLDHVGGYADSPTDGES